VAQRILNKKASLPRYLQRKERPWFRKAATLLNKCWRVRCGDRVSGSISG